MLELLFDTHILHEIHGGLLGQGELTTAHVVSGVFQDVDIATESEIHLVVRQEMEVDTTVAVDLDSVLDVETVEVDGILANR